MTFVVDTNVAVVANGRDWLDRAPGCVQACIQIVREITADGCIAVDDLWLILREYKNNLNESGEPGVGDQFLKWVLTNTFTPRCCLVTMREFPDHPELSTFDPSDRKFVQVALAHNELPPILQATDTKWRQFEALLRQHRIDVRFLCD